MKPVRVFFAGSVTVLAAALGACASSSGSSSTPAAPRSATAPTRGSSNVIVAAEIEASGVSDALQAVKLLRPAMLRGRSGSSSDQSGGNDMVVYVDGVKSGGPGTLDQVTAISIREIRYLNAADATTRYGTGHTMGAILVATKR